MTITLSTTSTIANLKELLKEETGHVPAHQVLCYMGKETDDSKSLADYRLKDDDKLTLVAIVPKASP